MKKSKLEENNLIFEKREGSKIICRVRRGILAERAVDYEPQTLSMSKSALMVRAAVLRHHGKKDACEMRLLKKFK